MPAGAASTLAYTLAMSRFQGDGRRSSEMMADSSLTRLPLRPWKRYWIGNSRESPTLTVGIEMVRKPLI